MLGCTGAPPLPTPPCTGAPACAGAPASTSAGVPAFAPFVPPTLEPPDPLPALVSPASPSALVPAKPSPPQAAAQAATNAAGAHIRVSMRKRYTTLRAVRMWVCGLHAARAAETAQA